MVIGSSVHMILDAYNASFIYRQMAEKEEEFKKMEEEKKRNEEKGEDMKRRLANDKRREERPQHLNELFKLNLDSAPIRELKAIMEKMGISPRGCIDRKDLKAKLHANVPELRLRQGMKESQTNSKTIVCVHVCTFMNSIISERAKRASSVIVHVNRDLRYVYICGRTSTSMRMPKKVLLRNALATNYKLTVTAAQVSRVPIVSLELRTKKGRSAAGH